MMRVIFRPPTPSDLDALAASMRAMDRKECAIISGLSPREALEEGVANSPNATVAEIDGQVVCAFGCADASFLGGDGYPWLLCAEGIERHARTMLTCAPRFVGEMRGERERLSNVVHADNRSAIRFLRWLGFMFGEVFHVKGEPFLPFEWTRAEAREAA